MNPVNRAVLNISEEEGLSINIDKNQISSSQVQNQQPCHISQKDLS